MTKKELIEALAECPDDTPIITRESGQILTLRFIDEYRIDAHIICGIVYYCGPTCPFCHSNPNSKLVNVPVLIFD